MVTHDDSRRLQLMMAELRDLAMGVRTLKPDSAPTQGQGESSAVLPEPRLQADVSQKVKFGELVDQVDFPNFVARLVKGVFQAIVDSSIQQMDAYSKLLSEVAQTIEDRCKLASC